MLITTANLFSQTDVYLTINHNFDGEVLEYGTIYTVDDANLTIDRLEYYISKIHLIHDGGQQTLVEDFWILVDVAEESNYFIGNFDINVLEGISYSIGVEPEVNHTDLTLWPSHHPLAPQNPNMHWGWTAGYKFIAIEGTTGQGLASLYQIHALGDELYFSNQIMTDVSADNNSITISLDADYEKAFMNIDVSEGPITHGTFGEAITICENFRDHVFTPTQTQVGSSIDETILPIVTIGPNPTDDAVIIHGIENFEGAAIQIIDAMGQIIYESRLIETISLQEFSSGLYHFRILSIDGRVITKQIVKR